MRSFNGLKIEVGQEVVIKDLAGGEHEFIKGVVHNITPKRVQVDVGRCYYDGELQLISRKPEQVISGITWNGAMYE